MIQPPDDEAALFGIEDAMVREAAATYVELLRASRVVLGQVMPLLARNGLTQTQFGVLAVLLHDGEQPHGDLGRKVLSSAGNMTDVVDKLEARGLVCRIRDVDDRRTVRVAMTTQGHELIAELFPRHAKDIARAMSALSASELCHLRPMLRLLGSAAPPGEGGTPNVALERQPT